MKRMFVLLLALLSAPARAQYDFHLTDDHGASVSLTPENRVWAITRDSRTGEQIRVMWHANEHDHLRMWEYGVPSYEVTLTYDSSEVADSIYKKLCERFERDLKGYWSPAE